MYILLFILIFFALLTWLVLNMPVFGKLPKGSKAYENLSPTPMMPDGVNYFMLLRKMIEGNPNKNPDKVLPHVKPDFTLSTGTHVTWFGHSSYLLQIDTLKILVDPVFSKSTSPFSFIGNKNYDGTDFIKSENFPLIDILIITHDHYDHLDYQTILKFKGRVKHFLTSAGIGSHLRRWGIAADQITELGWWEEAVLSGLKFTATPARHFTGRAFTRNHTLWSGFVVETPLHKLYLGGDSGYDSHFAAIGNKFGPFDLAILECGQYNEMWPYIHMFPEQTVQAAIDLKAKALLPVHWGKFSLALHDWNEPIMRVVKRGQELNMKVATPLLGETVSIGQQYPDTKWW